jgi:hypothetical protein
MPYGANEAVVSALMKKVYPGAITNQLNEEVGPWAAIEKTRQTVFQGQDLNRSLRVGRNQGIGSRGDTERLPNPGKQRHVQATITMSSTYIVGEFTGRVVRRTYSDEAAFENVMENEMRNSLTDFTNDIARQAATGHGRLAKVVSGGAQSATTFVVDSYLNLEVDQQVVVYNGATEQSPAYSISTGVGGFTISDVNIANNTITVTPAVAISGGLTAGAFLYRAGNFDGTTVKEMQGLSTIISNTGTYFNIARATEPQLQANVMDFTGVADVDFEDKMQQASDAVFVRGGSSVDVYFTDTQTRRRFLKQLQKQRVYQVTGGAPTFAGGNGQDNKELRRGLEDGLTFNGVPFIASRRIDVGTIYGLDTSTWEALEQSDVEWVMNGESVLHPLLSAENRDAFRFSAYKDMQLFNVKPNSNIKMSNAS